VSNKTVATRTANVRAGLAFVRGGGVSAMVWIFPNQPLLEPCRVKRNVAPCGPRQKRYSMSPC
jgi:hypothetical protein